MKKETTAAKKFIDPVCSMEVEPTEEAHRFQYEACTYYFCAESCRRAFVADPQKYLGAGKPKRKGLWGRYLERLAKSTDGKAMKCH